MKSSFKIPADFLETIPSESHWM